jgi:hypothetical protein
MTHGGELPVAGVRLRARLGSREAKPINEPYDAYCTSLSLIASRIPASSNLADVSKFRPGIPLSILSLCLHKHANLLFALVFRLPAMYVSCAGNASAHDRQEDRMMTMSPKSAVFHNSMEHILWNKVVQ